MVFPIAMLAFYLDKSKGYVMERELPDIWTGIGHFIVFAIVREITFYYSHRLLHHPYFYKSIHKKHHMWTSPIAIAAAYCHPVEHIVSNVIPIALGKHPNETIQNTNTCTISGIPFSTLSMYVCNPFIILQDPP